GGAPPRRGGDRTLPEDPPGALRGRLRLPEGLLQLAVRHRVPRRGPGPLHGPRRPDEPPPEQLLPVRGLRPRVRQVRRPGRGGAGRVALPALQRPGAGGVPEHEPARADGAARHVGAADDGHGELLPARGGPARRLPRLLLRLLAPAVPGHRVHRLHGVRAHLRADGAGARRPVRDAAHGRGGRRHRPAAALPAALGRALPRAARAGGGPDGARGAGLPRLGGPGPGGRRAGACRGPGRGSPGDRHARPGGAAPAAVAVHAHDQQPVARDHPGRGVPGLRAGPRPARAGDLRGTERRLVSATDRPATDRPAPQHTTAERTADAVRAYRPALRDGVLISPALLRGPRTVHLVKHPVSQAAFEIGPRERFVLGLLDGTRDADDVEAAYAQRFRRRLPPEQWPRLRGPLGTRGLLDGSPDRAPPEPPPARTGTLWKGSRRAVADAQATTGRLHRLLRPLLRS